MNPASPLRATELPPPRRPSLLLPGLFFLLGAVLTGLWFQHRQAAHPAQPAGGLATATQTRLGQLAVPVTIRFYSLLPGNPDATLPAFAGRVAQLLDAVQTAGGDKVRISRVDTPAEANATAASTDGLQAFNLDQGGASFLGLTIASGTNREVFARLDPEWEPALEYDLIRAIVRVTALPPPPKPAPEIAQPNPEILASIHRLIPDTDATTVETANQIFHAEFMKESAAAWTEMKTAMNAAQQRVITAQTGGSPADLEAAQKNLGQVQLAQADKLKQIAARLHIRLVLFQNLKNPATNNSN